MKVIWYQLLFLTTLSLIRKSANCVLLCGREAVSVRLKREEFNANQAGHFADWYILPPPINLKLGMQIVFGRIS